MTNEELREQVEAFGLEECLFSIEPNRIADKAVSGLWRSARDMLVDIEDKLNLDGIHDDLEELFEDGNDDIHGFDDLE